MTTDSNTIRILVVDDQQLIRQGISTLLAFEPDIDVVGLADNGQTAIEQAMELCPDLILMDIQMPIMNGIDALLAIRQQQLNCQVLMLTTFNDDQYIVKALQAGAVGYLLKDMPSDDLAQAVRSAYNGIHQLSPDVAGKLVSNMLQPTPPVEADVVETKLTPRELDVLRLIAAGTSNKEIAQQLTVTEGTVKKHISNILQSLDLRDRTQAALYAVKHKLA